MPQVELNRRDGVRSELDLREALQVATHAEVSLRITFYGKATHQNVVGDDLLCSRTISDRFYCLNIIVDGSQLLEQLGRKRPSGFEAS
jgi:hypothetical protein